jgi:uncharacterized delta-60 repeat protein
MNFASVFSRVNPLPAGRPPAGRTRGSRRFLAVCALVFLAAWSVPGLYAQSPGTQDTSFVSGLLGSTIFAIADESINDQELIVAGGDFEGLNRLYLSGAIDTNFEIADFGDLSRIIYTIVPQILTDQLDQDKTLVGGLFGSTLLPDGDAGTGPPRNILRLNSNGLIDSTFNPGTGSNGYITSIVPEPNGSMYVGGLFDHFNGIEHHHVVRLDVDGSIDLTFSSALSINDSVLDLADEIDAATGLSNGQILVVGTFNHVDSTSTAKVARLNNDGSLDTSFKPLIDTRVLAVAVQSSGQIIIGGSFTSVNGTPVQNIARLNYDGSLDTSFAAKVAANPPLSPDPTAVYVLKILSDGRIYVGGNFYSVNGTKREYLARLMPDGTLDTSFDPGSAVINSVQSLAVQQNNDLLVGETVSRKINNVFPASLIRLYSDNPPIPPVVNITASRPEAAEIGKHGAPKKGQFQLVRGASGLSSQLTVFLAPGGTAVAHKDYKALTLEPYAGNIYERTFPPGINILNINVAPRGNPLTKNPATVTLSLRKDQSGLTNYTLGPDRTATVTITNTVPP